MSFVVEREAEPLPRVAQETGIDLGSTAFATVAVDGGTRPRTTSIGDPCSLKPWLRRPRRPEREKARHSPGSRPRAKTRGKVALRHGKIVRSRFDHPHMTALDPNVTGLRRDREVARAVGDAGWARLARTRARKAEFHGRTLHRIDRWYRSSRLRTDRGHPAGRRPPHIRTREGCGAVHDREEGAAQSIIAAGWVERRNACGHHVGPPFG
ncbi:transposase [Umezawaea sp. Da 62-37]|uniref:transposase n=1 Tax=Umezawaea sp. Da 62-37 TaxID=3075927 RepID=UPI0028F72362|nr:transposase [Umezawaea sp. Da 62-37]WNV82380.1 transposase [Umezawaea sp. Da 62-37]